MRGAHFLRKILTTMVAMTTMLSLVAVPLPAAAAVKPAADPGYGTVQGVVKDPDNVAITGDAEGFDGNVIMVEVWNWDGASWNQVAADEYGNDFQVNYDDGTYAFDLPEGTYKLRFYDWFGNWSNEGYRPEFYPNSYTVGGAANVVVTDQGTTTANMTLDLWQYGAAAGVVTDATSHNRVSDVSIIAYNLDGFGDWNYDGMWGDYTLSMGDWENSMVPVGQYKVEFTDLEYYRYTSQWYGGGTDIDTAPWVTISPMHTVSGLNAEMVRLGHIKGRVTAPGGAGLAGISMVALVDTPEGWMEQSEGSHQKVTDANGYYDYIGLPAGTYRMAFWDNEGLYLTKAYGGTDSPGQDMFVAADSGSNIVVASGATVNSINTQLTAGARLIGHVRDGASDPVEGVDVTAIDSATGAKKGTVQTDDNGDYVLGNLTTGSYKVRFDVADPDVHDGYYPSDSGDLGYLYTRRFYSSSTTTAGANVITIPTTGTYGTPIDATLAQTANWGYVGARVTGPSGSELAGIEVYLDYSDGGSGWIEYHGAVTDYTGYVWFPYVPMGTVTRVRANAYYDLVACNDRWSTNSTTYTVASSSWSADLALAKPAEDADGNPLGMIHGKVSDAVTAGHVPAAPITTYLYDGSEYWLDGQMTADSAGWFEIPVPEGDYLVEAGPTTAYASEFYNNASSISSATNIAVIPPATTSLISMPLAAAHTISGTIRDKNGTGLRDIYVSALKYNPDWDTWEPVTDGGVTSAFSAADGTYTLGGLSNGTYRVMAYGWGSDLGAKGWKASGQAQSVDQADDIVLSNPASAHIGYNMTLTPAVRLRGSVTDGDAKRVTGVHVNLWWDDPAGDWALISSTYTYHDGDFEFGQFSAGNYFLEFIDDTNYLYADSWYKSVPVEASAVAIPLIDAESKIITQTIVAGDTAYTPISGPTRIDTAVKASMNAFPEGAGTIVLATGFNWPDALGGAALAGAYDGPILLTSPTTLPSAVLDEIDRLGAADAIILGGVSAVGLPIETSLKRKLGSAHVSRLAGGNRFETAALVAEATIDRLGDAYDGTAFVSTGGNFPDALGASPLAAASNWPIYLTGSTALTPVTRTSMAAHGVNRAIILGGTGAVSSGVESSLNTLLGGSSHTTRLSGRNRYETAVVVAQWGVDNVYGLGWNNVAIATGQNYPDALAGGVMQGQAGSVLLLTPSLTLDPYVAAKLAAEKNIITEVSYLGGTGALSPGVRTSIQRILK